jgi:ribosomal protein L11 methyltransferase
MKPQTLWKISVSTTAEAEDAVSESLGRIFNSPASTHTDFRTGRITASVFTEAKPIALLKLRFQLKQSLAQLKTFGLAIGPGRIRVEEIRRENWAESWKRHFKPIEIGDALLVKPSWIKRRAKPGQAVVVLDPGLSFGTGQHPTTSFCLRESVRRRKPNAQQAFLDIGTGSGILAIAAVKLGYAPVHAFDFDPESVRVARANARVNRVQRKLRITRRDLTKLPFAVAQRYDIVCANLISTLLIAERERIVRRLKPSGALVVAGILLAEFSRVRAAFEPFGLRLVASKREKEWASGMFVAAR